MSLDSKDPKKRGIGFSFALKGILDVFRSEMNFKIHVISAVLVIFIGLITHLSEVEWLFILLAIAMVFLAEILNTAIEQLVNYLFTDYHPVAGKVKDMAAGAVFIASLFALAVGLIIFTPKIVSVIVGH